MLKELGTVPPRRNPEQLPESRSRPNRDRENSREDRENPGYFPGQIGAGRGAAAPGNRRGISGSA
jgi:hypothetical protein